MKKSACFLVFCLFLIETGNESLLTVNAQQQRSRAGEKQSNNKNSNAQSEHNRNQPARNNSQEQLSSPARTPEELMHFADLSRQAAAFECVRNSVL